MGIVSRYTRERWAANREWDGVENYVTGVVLLFREEDDPDDDVEPRVVRMDRATGEPWPEDAEPLPPVPFHYYTRDSRHGWVLEDTGDDDPHAHERVYVPRPGASAVPEDVAETDVSGEVLIAPVACRYHAALNDVAMLLDRGATMEELRTHIDITLGGEDPRTEYHALLAVAAATDALRGEIAHADDDGVAFMHSPSAFAACVDQLDVTLDVLQAIQEQPDRLTAGAADDAKIRQMCQQAHGGDPTGELALLGRFGQAGRVLAHELRTTRG